MVGGAGPVFWRKERMKRILGRGCWSFLAAAAVLAAPLCAARGEQAVGLEAQGVDPWAALRPGGLDVRDELGRPVRAEIIETQVKAANAEAAARASFSSRLPKAGTIIRLLELLEALKTWLSPFVPFPESRPVWALAPAAPGPQKSLLLFLLASLTAALSARLPRRRSPAFPGAAGRAPDVLRC